MDDANDPIVYRYEPGHDGAGYPGVPQRDLRQSDLAALVGTALRDLTLANGGPYVAVDQAPPVPAKSVAPPSQPTTVPSTANAADSLKGDV